MKTSKLIVAIASVLGTTLSFNVIAIELYIDTKTQQIYGKPGKHRQLLGTFEKVDKKQAVAAEVAPAQLVPMPMVSTTPTIPTERTTAAAVTPEKPNPEGIKTSLKNGLRFESSDGNFVTEIHGRVQLDTQENVNQDLHSNFLASGAPATLDNDVGLRRARLSMEGSIYKNTDYKLEYDFTRGQTAAAGITDGWVRYNFSNPLAIRIGSFKEPLSLEEATSDIQTSFLERNMAVNTFIDNLNVFRLGIGATWLADRWTAQTAVQTEGPGSLNGITALSQSNVSGATPFGSNNRNNSTGDTSWEVNGRVTALPWMESKTKLWHIGGWGSYVNINNNYAANGSLNNGGIFFANNIGNNMDRTNMLNTGNLSNAAGTLSAQTLTRFGAETALVYGPFSAQAEYLQTDVSGRGYADASVYGYYGYMTYFLTGESRNYVTKGASFDRVKPNRNFSLGNGSGWGAWELLAGYDHMNLNSGAIQGGFASVGKLGVNWYFNPRIRLMTNWVHAFDINTSGVVNATAQAFNNAKVDMIESRVQIDW